MKYLLLLIAITYFFQPAYCFEHINIKQNHNESETKKSSFNEISKEEIELLEKKIFNKIYKQDNIKKRLSRIEIEIFGMEQAGNLSDRFEKILTALEAQQRENIISKKYDNYEYKYEDFPPNTKYYTYDDNVSPKKETKVKKFINDITDTFSQGSITGYTPPIYFNNYSGIGHQPYYYHKYYPKYIPNYNNVEHNPSPPPPRYYGNNSYRNRTLYPINRNYNTSSRVHIIK